jgi:hypothetical protein
MAKILHKRDGYRTVSGHYLSRIVSAVVLVVGTPATRLPAVQGADNAEERLEAAIHREVVVGDLNGAMSQYRGILAEKAVPRSVAARALLQLGECQEKLGQDKEAYSTYRLLVADYAGEAAVANRARLKLSAWSGPRNLRFEEGAVGKKPPGWFVPSLPKDADYVAELRRADCHSRVGCAVVQAPATAPNAIGNLMQSFSAAAYRGKTVRLSASLRLESFFPTSIGLHFPSAEDRAQLWFKVERANRRTGFSDNMDDRPVRSDQWTRCEITGMVDDDAQFINFGVLSIGTSRVWVDDIAFAVMGK